MVFCGKPEKCRKMKATRFHKPLLKKEGVVHVRCRKGFYPQKGFPFPRETVEKGEEIVRQRRDVMLVLSSFTFSEKAGSFFIFCSTWAME